jgi:hypothetical protein
VIGSLRIKTNDPLHLFRILALVYQTTGLLTAQQKVSPAITGIETEFRSTWPRTARSRRTNAPAPLAPCRTFEPESFRQSFLTLTLIPTLL